MTAREWTEAACRMQKRAEISNLLGRHKEEHSYLRRRNYAASKAEALGQSPWGAIDRIVGQFLDAFWHLRETP